MNELNPRYNVDVSPYPLLTQALHTNRGQAVLVDYLAQSTLGEKLVLFNQVPDGNDGQERPGNPLFGELVARTPIILPASTARLPVPDKAFQQVVMETEMGNEDSVALG